MPRVSVLCFLSLLLTARVAAQTAPAVTLPGTQQYDVKSSVNGQEYRLYVAPPAGYSPGDTTHYPVLYLLDGHFAFPAAVAARDYMGLVGALEHVIIVGIGNGEYTLPSWFAHRWRDYTPTGNTTIDTSYARQFNMPAKDVRSGGGPAFLQVLRTDLIPFIERTYRTSGDRGLSGHSLGGLFTAFALFAAPDLFQRYGINSPSLWWNDSEMFAAESTFSATHTALPKRVLFTIGANEGTTMVPPMERFARLLGSRGYQGLVLDTVIFAGESHTSVGPATVARTLRVLYGARR
jgi:predicted alpha/beta superfamily hydrolase